MLHAVVMAGGSGTRFWPESRADRPKQFLKLVGERTMIQATVDRLERLVPPERVMVVTNRRLADLVAEQLPDLPPEAIVREPCRRDTAPCIALAAELIVRRDPQATMVVLPADHAIAPTSAFQASIRMAAQLVNRQPNRLLTFGIAPTYAAESFGYIERGEPLEALDSSDPPVYRVARFREKPKAAVARDYLASGRFYWNSGIFVWKAATVLAALKAYEPAMAAALEPIAKAAGTTEFDGVLSERFAEIEGKSIDYAVMEPAAESAAYEVLTIEASFAWDDVGSWQALSRLRGTDDHGNTIAAEHLGLETEDCIIRGPAGHLIVTLGVDHLIVVHTPGATLVADKRREESIRRLVAIMKERGLDKYL